MWKPGLAESRRKESHQVVRVSGIPRGPILWLSHSVAGTLHNPSQHPRLGLAFSLKATGSIGRLGLQKRDCSPEAAESAAIFILLRDG